MSTDNNDCKKPAKKVVVEALMKQVGELYRMQVKQKDGKVVDKEYMKYACPKECCNFVSTFELRSGFSNPYAHLCSCYGAEKHLLELYDEAVSSQRKKGGSIDSHFQAACASDYDKAMFGSMDYIVMESLPVSHIESKCFRAISCFKELISKKTFKDVMFSLVELVEGAIAAELATTKCGALVHDGWTCNNTHFIGLFASYCRPIKVKEKTEFVMEWKPEITLLACSPMANIEENHDGDTRTEDEESRVEESEAMTFNAETHVKFFTNMLAIYGLTIEDWVVCQIANNCSTNKKIAHLMGKPHVRCMNHKLSLEVNRMVDHHQDMHNVIATTHETMKAVTQSLKNSALLRNASDLKPIMHNKMQWSGKYNMLKHFDDIRDELIEVSNMSESDLPINSSVQFANKGRKYARQLQEIDQVTKYLQCHGLTLGDGRVALDMLINCVASDKLLSGKPLYQCRLGVYYIAPDAAIVTDPHFEAGVIKIQQKRFMSLTDSEKMACACLLSPATEIRAAAEQPSTHMSVVEKIKAGKRKQREGMPEDEYINADFILASTAEVERLWSLAKYI